MEYEWDEVKNAANIAKHGVGFATACRIFEGPILSWIDDRTDGEIRRHSIGAVEGILFLAVIHTSRGLKSRMISARRASRMERKRYEDAFR